MIERDSIFGCVLATGRKDKDGYAFHGKTRAHIKSWTDRNGPVPDGLVLDHLCRRRNCTATHHLEAVTQSENIKRQSWKYRAKQTKCPMGHDMKVNAIVTPEDGRVCRRCNQEAGRG